MPSLRTSFIASVRTKSVRLMGSLLACSSAMMSLRVSLLGQNLTFVLFLTLLFDFIGLARFLLQLQYFGGIYLKPLTFLEPLDNMN